MSIREKRSGLEKYHITVYSPDIMTRQNHYAIKISRCHLLLHKQGNSKTSPLEDEALTPFRIILKTDRNHVSP